jgi:Fe-S-cluster-containing hydrogenase component 2
MHMSRKTALLNFSKCSPASCQDGVCAAALVCPSKLLKQDSPYAVPEPEPAACRACGECVRACPQKAIQIVSL